MDVQQTVGLAQISFTNPEYLVVQTGVHDPFLSPDAVRQTESNVYHYTKFLEGMVGYMPLSFPCARPMVVINFTNAALPYVLTAYPVL